MATYEVWVTATVAYKLYTEADTPADAEKKVEALWSGDGHTVAEWDEHFGHWDDVINLEIAAA